MVVTAIVRVAILIDVCRIVILKCILGWVVVVMVVMVVL